MATKFVVDTHSLIWYLEGNIKLGRDAQIVLDAAESELTLPIIALAEAIFTVEKGRTRIPDVSTLLDRITND